MKKVNGWKPIGKEAWIKGKKTIFLLKSNFGYPKTVKLWRVNLSTNNKTWKSLNITKTKTNALKYAKKYMKARK